MPPPSVSVQRLRAAPVFDAGTDFRMCILGASSLNPLAAGAISVPYGNPSTLAGDYGIGDGVDAGGHALTVTGDNPSPSAISFLSTLGLASTTPGVRGAITVTGVTGTSVPSNTAATHPLGTYEPRVRVVTGGTIGVAGIILQGSVDNGRTWLPTSALGTAVTWKLQIPNPGGTPIDTGVQYDLAAGTLVALDSWFEAKTTPPQWAIADLYTAGTPGTGALMTIAAASLNFGLVAITEPVAASDIATLSAALTAMAALRASCRPTLLVRFRNQAAGESDATFVTAFQTFRAACADDARIAIWVGDGWLTDAFRSYVYSRSGLPALLARLQGMNVIAGPLRKERIAQSPGLTVRGPLVGFTIHDNSGNPVGHDERVRPGIGGPLAGKGGGIYAYYEGADGIAGTYCSVASDVLYGVGSAVLTLMDNRVSSGVERVLYTVSFLALGGADIVTGGILDDDTREALASAGCKAIKDAGYENEFANAGDPNLFTVDAAVTVSGPLTTIVWHCNDQLYDYANAITVTIANGRP